ncbi:gp53-like domain-containing protein [Phyllobacterium meliloti]|uniref:gp53-like domain-containing protein n=1 Tax=Phyllobacterium meliloti TaxID=555317 RepID=UPI001D154E13|nr:hypothetical protein [Phyllobacterium sp. T1293]UGX87136.1 hypothetical protein LLE53_004625 [Phyllobacterium sp. T1293]
MAIKPDYDVGMIAVTAGATTVTGVGTFFVNADIQPGDMFGAQGYPQARVVTVNSNTSLTIEPWRGVTLAAGSSYYVRYQADGSRYTAAARALINSFSTGSVAAMQALTGAVDKIPYFTGTGVMALSDFKDWARSLFSLTPAADQIAYFTGAGTATLTSFKAWGRSLLGLTVAADKGVYFTDANTAATFDITAAGRAATNVAGTPAANKLPYMTSATASALADLTAFARTVLDDTTGAAMFTTMGGSSGGTIGASWQKLPSGLIFQYGSNAVTFDANGIGSVTFPTAFNSAATYNLVAWNGHNLYNVSFQQVRQFGFPSATAFAVNAKTVAGANYAGDARVDWIAIGV